MAGFLYLTTGADNRTFSNGEIGDRTVLALDGNDTLQGSSDSEAMNANRGSDLLFGGSGNDSLAGGQGSDTINGDDGDDYLFGNKGTDNLLGGTGNDFFFGGQDNDTLFGNEGNDSLVGDLGKDSLVGGDGRDVFILQASNVNTDPNLVDIIADFNNADDAIGLTGSLVESNITFVTGGVNGLPYTSNDTLLQLNISSTGSYIGVVLNATPEQLQGNFVSVFI